MGNAIAAGDPATAAICHALAAEREVSDELVREHIDWALGRAVR